jgi:hypothetical protein
MPFQVYPIPQTAPLSVPASGASLLIPISELVGLDPVTNLNTMFIRVVKIGGNCAPTGPPHPTFRLKANTGDAMPVPTFPTTQPLYNLPGGAGVEVADATMEIEANDIYRIRLFILQPGSSWQIQIVNTDPTSAHGFTWVVADNDADTRKPWIHLPATQAYDVLTTQAVPLSIRVENRGTGPLTISDAVGFSPGGNFVLTTVPPAISPNACDNLRMTFTGPAVPGTSSAVYLATSDDPTAQLGSEHNRRVSLSATTRKLEVVLLLDASGSMNAKPNGDPVVAASDSRWSKAVTAADQFLELLKAFGSGYGRFGVARFPDPFTCPTSADIQVGTDITVAAIDTAKTALGTNFPGDRTPIGHGIGRVIGTIAGSFGYFESSAASQSFNRRWLVLMSDGAQNCSPPDPTAFYGTGPTSFQGKKIAVITVGFGDPGAAIYAPDHTLLTNIEAASGAAGRFLDAGADDLGMGLLKSFRTAIVNGLSLDPTTDPPAVLTAANREIRRAIPITRYESKAAFVVNWGTSDVNRVRVEVLTPNCELITPAVAQADPNIDFAGDPRFTIYTFDDDYINNSASPDDPRHGDWTLIVAADNLQGSDREALEYEVIFESRLKMTVSLNQARYFAGDPIVLMATLTLEGQPVTGATVTCHLEAPGQFANNWLAGLTVTAAEMAAAKAALITPDANALTVKTMALRSRGENFLRFPTGTTVTMSDPERDGTYQATFGQTTTPGTYDFLVTAVGATSEGVTFRREKRIQILVDVRPDPVFTIWDTVYKKTLVDGRVFFSGEVRVFPRDRFGNVYLVDPEVTPEFELTSRGGEFLGPLVTNLDGSYSRPLQFAGDAKPVVSLSLADREFVADRAITSPAKLVFADTVVSAEIGHEARPGINKHPDPRLALGDVTAKERDEFVSLGGFGRVALGVKGQVIVGGAEDDVTVFVRPDEELRPYRVEASTVGLKPRWVLLGESPGVSQSFSLRAAKVRWASAVRIVDTSGRTRTNALRDSETPGVSALGVGFRQTADQSTAPPENWWEPWLAWLRRLLEGRLPPR